MFKRLKDLIIKFLSLSVLGLYIVKGLLCIKNQGFRVLFQKVSFRFKNLHRIRKRAKKAGTDGITISQEKSDYQKQFKFDRSIKISILVPLYNTSRKYLMELIESVKNQTYTNWELCLADGSDANHQYVEKVCLNACARDRRIIYQKLSKNKGISENTNRCIELSTGSYLGLLDHDDLLHPSALFEVMKAICNENADFIYTDEATFHQHPSDAFCYNFKSDYAPDSLRTQNYICHFTAYKRDLMDKVGYYRKEFDGSQDFDMVLRLTEKADKIVHIPKVLYFWRAHKNSVALHVDVKPYAVTAAKKAIAEHLERIKLMGTVLDSIVPSTYKIQYDIIGNPLVSIIIPNKDHLGDLKKCIDSILNNTTYQNFELLIIDNNSEETQVFEYYELIQKQSEKIKVFYWNHKFNYSKINNFGVEQSKGSYILLLNNDTEIITPDWIQEMLMFAQRSDVGGVGAKLYYPDNTIQHAGVIIGVLTLAGHAHRHARKEDLGYMGRLTYVQNLSAVTAACMMIPRHVYVEMNGLDETFEIAFNDIDFCMRIRQAGYLIVFTPYAELYHYESKSRGFEDTLEKQKRFEGEVLRFQTRWKKELAAYDPYYNPNLTLKSEDFSFRY